MDRCCKRSLLFYKNYIACKPCPMQLQTCYSHHAGHEDIVSSTLWLLAAQPLRARGAMFRFSLRTESITRLCSLLLQFVLCFNHVCLCLILSFMVTVTACHGQETCDQRPISTMHLVSRLFCGWSGGRQLNTVVCRSAVNI